MSAVALIHGAWGSGWHWGRVPELLRDRGHDVVAPDLPIEDPDATFDDYAGVVCDALEPVAGDGGDVLVVGFSLGGHVAPLVAARRPVRELVYLAALIPEPGRPLAGQAARGLHPEYLAGIEGPDDQGRSRWVDFAVYHQVACHDCTEPVARERFDRSRAQATGAYRVPCSLDALPDVPSRYVVCTDDRLLVNDFWTEAARSRLGVEPEELASSHAPMASQPEQLVDLLLHGA